MAELRSGLGKILEWKIGTSSIHVSEWNKSFLHGSSTIQHWCVNKAGYSYCGYVNCAFKSHMNVTVTRQLSPRTAEPMPLLAHGQLGPCTIVPMYNWAQLFMSLIMAWAQLSLGIVAMETNITHLRKITYLMRSAVQAQELIAAVRRHVPCISRITYIHKSTTWMSEVTRLSTEAC